MANLLWPGDHRGGQLLSDSAVCQAMAEVESAWLRTLGVYRIIDAEAADCDLTALISDDDVVDIARAADGGANPAIPLVALLRQRSPEKTRPWIHRGLTSQDVIDTALMLTLSDARTRLRSYLATHLRCLTKLADTHRNTLMVARTLTQPAIPTTFGAKVAMWLTNVCEAADGLARLRIPIQIGGAAGTLAAITEMSTRVLGPAQAAQIALSLVDYTAETLKLDSRLPWHTSRAPITAIGDSLVSCTDAWGRIAADVLTLNRAEIGELSEPAVSGRGGSSTMPNKCNPVLSVLLRRTSITTPPLAATLHTAAALGNDERADGAWHAEWDTLRILARRTLIAASHATDLLSGLHVNPDRMAANLASVDVSGEQLATAALVDRPPSPSYLGVTEALIDHAVASATSHLEEEAP